MCMLVHEEILCISIPDQKHNQENLFANMYIVGVPLGQNS